jgi:hypothetical protein
MFENDLFPLFSGCEVLDRVVEGGPPSLCGEYKSIRETLEEWRIPDGIKEQVALFSDLEH